MTIKQQGGIFGRNPAFNDVEVNDISLPDAGEASFGNSNDLKIYHSGSQSYIQENGTGNLFIYGGNMRLGNSDGSKLYMLANSGDKTDIYFDGSVKIRTESTGAKILGDLKFNSGNGIDFSATSGTGTSELFDDYEEGTWTVTVATGSVTGATTAKYIKCGTSVTVWVEGISFSDITSAADITIGGLPFTAAQSGQGSIICSYVGASSPNTVNVGGTTVKLYSSFVSGAFSAVQHSAFNSTANQLYFTATYQST